MNKGGAKMAVKYATEYMCTYCGMKQIRGQGAGRPMPGVCPRRKNGQPHRWVVNRKHQYSSLYN